VPAQIFICPYKESVQESKPVEDCLMKNSWTSRITFFWFNSAGYSPWYHMKCIGQALRAGARNCLRKYRWLAWLKIESNIIKEVKCEEHLRVKTSNHWMGNWFKAILWEKSMFYLFLKFIHTHVHKEMQLYMERTSWLCDSMLHNNFFIRIDSYPVSENCFLIC